MGGDKGFAAVFCDIPETALAQMGDVDDDPELVHPLHSFNAERFEPQSMQSGIRAVGKAQTVFIVPGERHHADTLPVVVIQHLNVSVEQDSVLDGEHCADAVLLQVFFQVTDSEDLRDFV